jgi:hypothetical protein
MKHVDSISENVVEIKFKNCRFVAFPRRYSEELFGREKTYFIPDSITIEYINENIDDQYCNSSHRFMENYFNIILKDDGYDNRVLKKEYRKFKRDDLKTCLKTTNKLNHFDKQLIGYINEFGEKIIMIQMIDFSEDPYNLKSQFNNSWICGWHGWFETNVRRVHFHLESKRFTINEEI